MKNANCPTDSPAFWSEHRVMEFAMKENHAALYCATEVHRYSGITWGQAMQLAAVEQAKSLKIVTDELIQYKMRYGELK